MNPAIEGIGCLTGIAPWKRKRLQKMLANANGPPVVSNPRKAVETARRNGGALASWASRTDPRLGQMTREAGVEHWIIEDGFIRSVGLGAALVQPCSVLVDRCNAHYDSRKPSDLEKLLQKAEFSDELLARSKNLIASIRSNDITKYNLKGRECDIPRDRKVVLVIGQVEDDLSVILGSECRRLTDYLGVVRDLEPEAKIVFKPHPDVVAGLRRGTVKIEEGVLISTDNICSLFDIADSVHTLTSLAGFEALLRGKQVTVHGQPFYSGWGLTNDMDPVERRTRNLSLVELVAGALIEYPVYCHPDTGRRCEVEELVELLAANGKAELPGNFRRIPARLAESIGRRFRRPGGGQDAASANL